MRQMDGVGGSHGPEGVTRGYRSLDARVAAKISDEIASRNLAPGDFLGHELDLTARHKIGRATLRSAIRQLETVGLAEMRPGTKGGLFVAGESLEAEARRLASHIAALGLPFPAVARTSLALFRKSVILAASRIAPASRLQLDNAMAEAHACPNSIPDYFQPRTRLRLALARTAKNPVLFFFFCAFDRVYRELLPVDCRMGKAESRMVREFKRIDTAIVRAVLDGNARLADSRASTVIEREIEMLHASIAQGRLPDRTIPGALFVTTQSNREKLAALTSRAIRREVCSLNFQPGKRLGTEATLAQHYGVSRNVMREAVRLSERDGLVRTLRGRGGGVVVAAASSTGIVATAVDALKSARATRRDFDEMKCALTEASSTPPAGEYRNPALDLLRQVVDEVCRTH